MVAVMSRLFGLQHIELAEDIVSETFLKATETWAAKGIPPNPTAWLYTVAKNRTREHLRRDKHFQERVGPELKSEGQIEHSLDESFLEENLKDSQLQMLFAVCNPAIASEAQIGLALRILCGFSMDEITEAFLSNREAINKRLFRAREKLRTENVKMEIPSEKEIQARLDNVLHIIYLLFNEGYYSTTNNQTLRKDLCREAIRLCLMLTEYAPTNQPRTNALLALMYFHASRFQARNAADGSPILYEDQDRALWDDEMVELGNDLLNLAAQGEEISSYHLEAAIAYWHCQREESAAKWENILQLYNRLLMINYSPIAALNRTYALYKAHGAEVAIPEALKLELEGNHFYFTLLGEMYRHQDRNRAREYYRRAHDLAKTQADRQTIQDKLDGLDA